MIEQKKTDWLCGWLPIIIGFVVFWPIGVVLLLRRAFRVPKTGAVVGVVLIVVGMLIWLLDVAYLVSLLFSQADGYDLIAVLIVSLVGLAVITAGSLICTDSDNPRIYGPVITSGLRRIDEIAAAVGKKESVVKSDLQRMIKVGQLKNAYINESTYALVLSRDKKNAAWAEEEKSVGRKVECAGCGADNIIYGEIGECEYCGLPLK